MILTEEQENILTELTSWFEVSEEKAIALQAPAGFGKTFVLAQFAESLNEKVTFIAPTHSALEQLELKISESENFIFKTVSKALGQVPIESNKSADVQFMTRGSSKMSGLVIVDESSMLSEQEIISLIKLSDKVIFSGDNNQLAPVKKKPGYAELMKLRQLTLTKMMRSESQAIVEAGLMTLKIPQFVPDSAINGTVIRHNSEDELKSAFLKSVVSEKTGDCVFITYSNKEVQDLNAEAHYCRTGRATLSIKDSIRLCNSCLLGKNNAIIEVKQVEKLANQHYKINGHTECALPNEYEKVKTQISGIVKLFNENLGSELLANELEFLRAVVLIDFPYAITTHKSQGSSIKIVFANSQKLHGRKSFYVAYSRAISQLNVCTKNTNTKGVYVRGTTWKHRLTGKAAEVSDVLDLAAVRQAISIVTPEKVPSVSHLACVLNPSHASKSAKGWTLV